MPDITCLKQFRPFGQQIRQSANFECYAHTAGPFSAYRQWQELALFAKSPDWKKIQKFMTNLPPNHQPRPVKIVPQIDKCKRITVKNQAEIQQQCL